MGFRYVHTNIIAKDWRKVSEFYQKVFRCRKLPDGTLEIFSYTPVENSCQKTINRPGFAHIAFEVDDVRETLNAVLEAGGGQVGEVVEAVYPGDVKATFVYAEDIEGNIIELQNWEKAKGNRS